jgi:hypothetical protein
MFRSLAPRAMLRATRPVSNSTFCASNIYFKNTLKRGYASEAGQSPRPPALCPSRRLG